MSSQFLVIFASYVACSTRWLLDRMDSVLNAPLEHLAALARTTTELSGGEPDQRDDLVPAARVLELLQQEINRIQRSMRLTLQGKLQDLVGRSLGSIDNNRALAGAIQSMLDQHGFRVRCHQCGHPAILRVSPRKGILTGAFVFDHTINGRRTFHGGTSTVPPIHLLAKPDRKTKASRDVRP